LKSSWNERHLPPPQSVVVVDQTADSLNEILGFLHCDDDQSDPFGVTFQMSECARSLVLAAQGVCGGVAWANGTLATGESTGTWADVLCNRALHARPVTANEPDENIPVTGRRPWGF
jgi:hypothetical protein